MNNFLKKGFSGIALATAVLTISQALVPAIPQAQASEAAYTGSALNSDPRDFPLLEVANYSRCPNNTCWSSSISGVQDGEIISFVIYAHNTGPSPATNTRARLNLTQNGNRVNGTATLSASNGNTVTRSVNVTLADNIESMTFVGGEYFANSSVDPVNPDAFPGGQSASQLANGGITIGTLANDYAGEFRNDVQIVVRYRVNLDEDGGGETCSRTATLNVTPNRDTIDVDDEAQYRAIYDSNGDCAGGESDVTNSASWSVDSTSIATSLGRGEFRGRREGSTTVRASYNGKSDTATLVVRDNNDDDDNDNDCDNDRATLVIVPYTASFGIGQTYTYRALYDQDGPGCGRYGDKDVSNDSNWSSNNSGIASSQSNGRFRGVAAGSTSISARYSGITATAQAQVVGNGGPTVIDGGTIVLPPTVIGGGTIVQTSGVGTIQAGVADASVACITVTPSVDVTSMLPGQEFVYTTLYRNDCPFALNSAVLRVFIPNDVEFIASSNPFFMREGQKFSYNLGILPPGGQGSVAISGYVRKDARIGDTETFTSTIEFLDSNSRIQGTTSYLVAVLGGDIRRTLTANLSDTLGHIFGSGWFWILIFLLVLAGIIWFIVSMIRRRHSTAATNKVVVAANDDPLRALRNA